MAIKFNAGTDYYSSTFSGITYNDMALSLWFYPPSSHTESTNYTLFHTADNANPANHYVGYFYIPFTNVLGPQMRFASDTASEFEGQVSPRTDQWNHVLITTVNNGGTIRNGYLNGVQFDVGTGTQPGDINDRQFNEIGINRAVDVTPWDGHRDIPMAHAALWSGTLSHGDALALYRGESPLNIRPNVLDAYYPLNKGGLKTLRNMAPRRVLPDLALTNNAPVAAGPPVIVGRDPYIIDIAQPIEDEPIIPPPVTEGFMYGYVIT